MREARALLIQRNKGFSSGQDLINALDKKGH
jgi:hypothetical protein